MADEKVRGTAYKALANAVRINTENNLACQELLDLLDNFPEYDAAMCKAFGLRPIIDVSAPKVEQGPPNTPPPTDVN